MKILIIEDEPSIRQSIVENFDALGYLCDFAADYPAAIQKIETIEYDCLVLDIMLPGGSGLQLLEHLREIRKNEGVIIISARGALEDRLKGLEFGADDYLTKPYHMSELSARVAAIIRRRQHDGQTKIQAGELTIDTEALTVDVGSATLDLTPKEFQLLLYLVVNKNRVLSKIAIANHLWGEEMPGHDELVYTHIKNLRKKIVAAGTEDIIRSIYGMGYKITLH